MQILACPPWRIVFFFPASTISFPSQASASPCPSPPLSLSGLFVPLSFAIVKRWRHFFAVAGRHWMIALAAFFRLRMLCCMSAFAALLGSITHSQFYARGKAEKTESETTLS